jgi:hypothetical protein
MTTTTNASVTAYPITIDYRKTFDEMLKAGKYDYANQDITSKHFSITGEGEVQTELLLVHFDRDIESDDAMAELDRMGLEPARLEHATAFGEKHPDVQRQYPIVFLGSVWSGPDGFRRVPYLDRWSDGRRLYLDYWPDEWDRSCRFAAVRKVLPAAAL